MADKDLSVKLRIEGDAKGASGALDATEKGLEKVGNAGQKTKTSTDALNEAFGKLGIRSARQIEADILEVNQALMTLARRTDLSGEEFDRAFAAGQARITQLRAELNGASGDIARVENRASSMLATMGALGRVFSGIELARQFVTVNVDLENMERTFRALTGTSEAAAQELDYVRDVANRLGLPLVAAGKAYADLAAATKGTAAEGQATRAVFESVAHAMSVAGKSADDTQGALLALSQMASKGTVAMEELRGQLGERLPGALNAVASGLGLTTAQLIKLVESGQLTAEELFPALAAGLNEVYGVSSQTAAQSETLAQKWEHLKNGVASLFKTIGDAGVVTTLKVALEGLETVVTVVDVGIGALGKDIGVFFGALAKGDIGLSGFSERAKQAFAEVEKEARDKLVKVAMHNRVMAASLDDAGKAALAAAREQTQAAAAIDGVGTAAQTVGRSLAGLNVKYAELKTGATEASKQAAANAEAKKAEGTAARALADAFGTEAEKRRAHADAARADATALEAVAAKRREEASLAQQHQAVFEKEIAVRGTVSDAQKKQADELAKLTAERQAEAEQAEGQARAAAVAAAAAETEANILANNAARVDELRIAWEAATVASSALHAEQAAGIAVGPALAEADIQAGAAAKLYSDALADKRAEIQQGLLVAQANLDVEQAGIRLAIEQQRTVLAVAKARGDERGAIAAVLEIKKLEIKLAELTAAAKAAEADAILQTVQIKREEMRATGEVNAAKEAELKAQEASAKVKQVEAQIAGETALRLRELADASRDAGDAAGKTGKGARDAADDMDRMGNAADSAADKLHRLRQEQAGGGRGSGGGGPAVPSSYEGGATSKSPEYSYAAMKAAGWSDSEVSNYQSDRGTSESEKAEGVVKRNVNTQTIDHKYLASQQGLFGDDAEAFSKRFEETLAREMASLQDKGRAQSVESSSSYMTAYAGHFNRAVQQAAEQAKRDARAKRTVEIKLPNGRGGSVDVASDTDADALTGILRQLESSASRSRSL